MSAPKQVIVVRKDLNMRKGKIAAQVAHASMKVLLDQMDRTDNDLTGEGRWILTSRSLLTMRDSQMDQWLRGLFTKVVVGVDSEEEMLDIMEKAKERFIFHALITDAGLTEFNGVSTNTCLALGPDYADRIDALTGNLKLL